MEWLNQSLPFISLPQKLRNIATYESETDSTEAIRQRQGRPTPPATILWIYRSVKSDYCIPVHSRMWTNLRNVLHLGWRLRNRDNCGLWTNALIPSQGALLSCCFIPGQCPFQGSGNFLLAQKTNPQSIRLHFCKQIPSSSRFQPWLEKCPPPGGDVIVILRRL